MLKNSVHSQRIADRFEIGDLEKDLLGWGSMGEVYRASDIQTGETVAVKVLEPSVVARDPGILERFAREGEALRQLDHPNIVRMVAAVEEEETTTGVVAHYLVMEYVAGGSLQELLDAQGALPPPRVMEIALELADALTRAHHLGIIHRDLKPANVLLAEDGTPRLTDFGIARISDSPRLTQTGILIGTPGFLSPEACRGQALDERTDIWAFGVLLFEMLTGETPFQGDSLMPKLTSILTQPVPDLAQRCPDAPEALTDLIYCMLEKDRGQRIPSVRLVGAELEAILKGREIPTPVRLVPGESRFAGESCFSTLTPDTSRPRHNLPAQPTPFVGREAELTELARLLANPDVRLLTILGAGGMGKTRLALEAGAAQLGNFEHGVYFVSLAPLQSAQAIVPTTAEALGFSFYEGREPRQQLVDYLREKNKLLIMDNFEHLLAGPQPGRGDGVGLVTDLLQMAPEVKVLSTSRARLNVQGEYLFPLAGMDFPEPLPAAEAETPELEGRADYSATRLFVQSARRVRPGFEPAAADLKYVAHICRLVQGMPLGILLAAAWVDMLTPEEIAAEIQRSLDFLETDLRDVPARQRSIRAAFDHSWRLLEAREREVFQGLSVFPGGFTREAALEVAGASLRDLVSLTNKSLVHPSYPGRYELHELLRQYGAERLDLVAEHGEAVRDRHCTYYFLALERWAGELKGARQREALEEMDLEIENARAAWTWAVAHGQVGRLGQGVEGIWLYHSQRLRLQEGEAAFQAAVDALEATDSLEAQRLRAKCLLLCSNFHTYQLRRDSSIELAHQGMAALQELEAAGHDVRGEMALAASHEARWQLWFDLDPLEAYQGYRRSVALCEELGDRWGLARALASLGWAAEFLGRFGEAQELCEKSLVIQQELGDQRGMADAMMTLGIISWVQGRLDEAHRLLQESLGICRTLGDWSLMFMALLRMGEVLARRGLFEDGLVLLESGCDLAHDRGYLYGAWFVLPFLAEVKVHLGRYEEARADAQQGAARPDLLRWGLGFARFVEGLPLVAQGAYLEAMASFQESIAVFEEVRQKENRGWALGPLGLAARGAGEMALARECVTEALQTGVELVAFMPVVYGLPIAALLLADQGSVERAVEVYACASRYDFVSKSLWFEDMVGHQLRAVAASLPVEVVELAQQRGRAQDWDAMAAEVLSEL
jgi:predicted ATPase